MIVYFGESVKLFRGRRRTAPAAWTSCLNLQMAICGDLRGSAWPGGPGNGAFICYPGGQCLLAGVQSLQLQTLLFPAPGCRVPWRHGNQTLAGDSSGSSHLLPCGCWRASQVCNPPDTGSAAAHLRGDHTCSSAFL